MGVRSTPVPLGGNWIGRATARGVGMIGERKTRTRMAPVVGGLAMVAMIAGCAGGTHQGSPMAGTAGGATANAAHSAAANNGGKGAVIGGAVGLIGAGNAPDRPPQKEAHEDGARDAASRDA